MTAALRYGGGGSVNPGAVQLLRQRPALGGNQENLMRVAGGSL